MDRPWLAVPCVPAAGEACDGQRLPTASVAGVARLSRAVTTRERSPSARFLTPPSAPSPRAHSRGVRRLVHFAPGCLTAGHARRRTASGGFAWMRAASWRDGRTASSLTPSSLGRFGRRPPQREGATVERIPAGAGTGELPVPLSVPPMLRASAGGWPPPLSDLPESRRVQDGGRQAIASAPAGKARRGERQKPKLLHSSVAASHSPCLTAAGRLVQGRFTQSTPSESIHRDPPAASSSSVDHAVNNDTTAFLFLSTHGRPPSPTRIVFTNNVLRTSLERRQTRRPRSSAAKGRRPAIGPVSCRR